MMPSQPDGRYDASNISGTHGFFCSCTSAAQKKATVWGKHRRPCVFVHADARALQRARGIEMPRTHMCPQVGSWRFPARARHRRRRVSAAALQRRNDMASICDRARTLYRSVMQIRTQYAFSTAAAMASSVDPDIISVSTHTPKPRWRMLAATRSTVPWTSHWYLQSAHAAPHRERAQPSARGVRDQACMSPARRGQLTIS